MSSSSIEDDVYTINTHDYYLQLKGPSTTSQNSFFTHGTGDVRQ